MRNAIVNFKASAVANLQSVMGAGAELDVLQNVTEFNRALQRGGVYDKVLFWHPYPVEADEDQSVLIEHSEALEEMNALLQHSSEPPEVWIMEKTREACAYDYERLGAIVDLVIVHAQSKGALGPILQCALSATVSSVKVKRNLVGLYDAEEYEKDIAELNAMYQDGDGFENGFEDGEEEDPNGRLQPFDAGEDTPGFDEPVPSSRPMNFDDEFEDEFEPDDTPAPESAKPFDESEPYGEFGIETDVSDFTDSDNFETEPEPAPEPKPVPSRPSVAALFENDIEDEFEESTPGFDMPDEFEETVSEDDFTDAEQDEVELPEDEFEDAGDAPEAPVAAPAPEKKKFSLFGKKEKAPKPVPAPKQAPTPAPKQAPVIQPVSQMTPDEKLDLVENATLNKAALNVLKSVCAKRCCQITVTGERGSGKSTVAMNLGNILSKHFRVLVVDMDGQTRGISYMQNDLIQNIPVDDSSMRSLFTAGLNSGNKPFVVRKNLAVSTMGLKSDTFVTNDAFTVNNVTRAHNQLMKDFDFIIYDTPLSAALDKLTSFITTSYTLYCVEASNYGFMNLLLRIGNLEDDAVAQQLVENGIVVPTKSTGYAYVGNIPVRNTQQALKAVQQISDELVGGECALNFAEMDFTASLPFTAEVQKLVGSKTFYSDTRNGNKEYSKLLASIFGL